MITISLLVGFISLIAVAFNLVKIIFRVILRRDVDLSLKKWYFGSWLVFFLAFGVWFAISESSLLNFFGTMAFGAFVFLVNFLIQMVYLKIRGLPIESSLKKTTAACFAGMLLIYPIGSALEPSSWAEIRLSKEAELAQKREADRAKEAEEKAAEEAKKQEQQLAEAQAAEAKKRAEEQAKAEAEKKKAEEEAKKAEEQAKAEQVQQQALEEKKQAEEEAKNKAAEKTGSVATQPSKQDDDDGGIWGSIKSYVGGKLSGAAEYAGGLVSNEIHVYDRTLKDGDTLSYYIVPSTKKRKDFGLIFKDEGYTIEVLTKTPEGKVLVSQYYWFVETDEGWKWQEESSSNSWFRIKSQYSELDKAVGLEAGKAIFDASKHLPNLGVDK